VAPVGSVGPSVPTLVPQSDGSGTPAHRPPGEQPAQLKPADPHPELVGVLEWLGPLDPSHWRCGVATIADVVDPHPELVGVLDAKFAEFEESAVRSARAYGDWRRRFERLHFLLGVPATVLAGVAGATAFSQRVPDIVVGICAALAAALAGAQTLVRPDRRARFNQTQQFVLARLATQAANFRELALPSASLDDARTRLDALYDDYHTALARSPD
jgi:hypothetical protein